MAKNWNINATICIFLFRREAFLNSLDKCIIVFCNCNILGEIDRFTIWMSNMFDKLLGINVSSITSCHQCKEHLHMLDEWLIMVGLQYIWNQIWHVEVNLKEAIQELLSIISFQSYWFIAFAYNWRRCRWNLLLFLLILFLLSLSNCFRASSFILILIRCFDETSLKSLL